MLRNPLLMLVRLERFERPTYGFVVSKKYPPIIRS